MRQVNNVLIILGITAVMAIITAVLAYLVDLIPAALDGNRTWATSNSVSTIAEANGQLALK